MIPNKKNKTYKSSCLPLILLCTLSFEISASVSKGNSAWVYDTLYNGSGKEIGQSPGLFASEVRKMMSKAKQYNFKYQLAIPASASAHEFESKGGKSTGYAQIDYVKTSYKVFKQYKVNLDPNFVGVALWAWADQRWSGGKQITPSIPNEETQDFLAKNL